MRKLTFVAALLLAACATIWAQSTAQINGTVKDSSGLAVPGAEVTATQTATGAVRTATSGGDGGYVLANLPIGPYMVEISKEGFSKYVQSGIVLQIASNPTIDAALKVGSVSDQVTVEAGASLVETHSTGVGTVVDNQRVVELPLNGRNATELIFLAGMATTGNNQNLNSVRNYPTVVISVAGGGSNGMAYNLDGANHNDANNNLNLPLPFPDALQEFKVETSALAAQYGLHAAAAVNAVTKSGTNEFHGDLFEFLRNGDFNARNFFAPTRDSLKRNQFGGVIGGPVRRDKLFFFAGYQGTRERSDPQQSNAYVPTAAMLQGDFTAIASAACQTTARTLPAAQGFTGNKIAPSLFNPAALKIAARLPVSPDPCGQIRYGLKSNQNEDVGVARIDWQQSDKHTIFGRYNIANLEVPTTYDGKNGLTLNANAQHDRVQSIAIGDTYLIGSSTVSSFRVGANRTVIPKIVDNFATWPELGVNAPYNIAPSPRLSVSGNGFGIGGGGSIVNIANTGPNYTLSEDVSLVKGSHQFGFGYAYLKQVLNYHSGINATGLMTFNGSVTGISLADFMVGQAVSWAQGNVSTLYNRLHYNALYAQDTWKATSHLTISYGIRWEPYQAMYSKEGLYNHFDQKLFDQNIRSTKYVNAPAGEIFPGDPQYTAGNSPHGSKWNTWAPRIGVAWDPAGDGKMSIRAAYGIFNDRMHLYSPTSFGQDAPYGNVITLNNVNLSNPWASYPGGNPLPIALSKNMSFAPFSAYVTHPLDFQPTYVHQWNLSVQRQFGKDLALTVNYVGNTTIHLQTADELNPGIFLGTGPCTIPTINAAGQQVSTSYSTCSTTANINQRRRLSLQNPAQGQYYSVITALNDGGTASYEGLFLGVQKRLSGGVSVLANYTWSHCISDTVNVFVGNNGTSSVTPGNRRADRTNCVSADQRQIFNMSAVFQSPKFSGRVLRMLATGWQVSPIVRLRSANFFSVTTGTDIALNGEGGQRGNLIDPAKVYPAEQTIQKWIDRSAFAIPATGTLGNLRSNMFRGPGNVQFDAAFSRTFRVQGDRRTVQLRGEAFNLMNWVNFNSPSAALNSGTFGQITGAGAPRIIQLAMKFVF